MDEQPVLAAVVQLAGGMVPSADGPERIVFLESAVHLDHAVRLSGPNGVVFSPEPGDPPIVAYEGGLSEPGDELLVGDDLFVYTQDYLATPFLAVAGPTVVRIGGEADYAGFLQDADLARARGVFVEQLLHPGVFLADQCALGTTHPCAGARRLHVSAAGEVRTAPGGPPLGTVESFTYTGDKTCLGGVIDTSVLDEARASRPWLSRYLRAVDTLRDLRANGRSGYAVSGFGARLTEGLPDLQEPVDAPLLLWHDDEFLMCDPVRERVFRLGRDAAKILELVLLTGSAGQAAELAAQHLGLGAAAPSAVETTVAKLVEAGALRAEVPA
ncbi:daptide biosynthesis RiPP recognition protein [Amycolatopsis sp. NPDC059021]|uniref:daptide biosynthesis RiPP recognition protein n=1 Tax=Amycolatopsis sp. NPDC059021 TaxID=3346704 RepID=UPI00366F7FB5